MELRASINFKKLIIFVIGLSLLLPSVISANEIPPTEVINAAKEGLMTFLKAIPVEDLSEFGFLSQQEIEEAELGDAFQVHKIPPDQLLNYEKGLLDFKSLVVPTNLWEFVILKGNQAKAVLTVDFFKNRWTAVGIGSSGLAIQLNKIIESWPSSSGYQHKLIRIYQGKADLVEISRSGTSIGLIPLSAGRVAMGLADRNFNALDLHDPQNALLSIIPTVKENVQRWK